MVDELFSLAAELPKEAKALAASATLMLATALEQRVYNRIQLDAKTPATADEVDTSQTPYAELVMDSTTLRCQIVELPKIISRREFQFNPNSPYVQQLHELVSIRNELMHLKDQVTVLDASRGQLVVHGARVTFDLNNLPSPEFRWEKVSLTGAKAFREAARIYFEEVLDPKIPPGLAAGRILCRCVGR